MWCLSEHFLCCISCNCIPAGSAVDTVRMVGLGESAMITASLHLLLLVLIATQCLWLMDDTVLVGMCALYVSELSKV